MSMRTQISAMVFMMVQAVLFGAGVLTILLTPLSNHAMLAMPVMIALSVCCQPLSRGRSHRGSVRDIGAGVESTTT
ncbi:hypothetical protein [Bradyrhizobium sp. SZCCHNRI1073]|uniref:hypothetical protein n=1 Tax=Bradyrhizobium sp. SZCCHNRI1073 TaxID=3057280 RepID=UPI0029162465|nr:hypothetical protein [Bradyrhizobium sp. SZCCHNRI1073]